MKIPSSILFLFILAVSSYTFAEATGNKLTLAAKDDAFLTQSMSLIDGKSEVCIVGNYYDVDGPRAIGKIVVVDTARNKIVWQKKIPAPDDAVNNRFVGCRMQGDFIYVAANVDSDSAQSTNQSLVYVYKFAKDGKQLTYARIATSSDDAWAYDLDVSDGDLKVVGLTKGSDSKSEFYSIFVSKFNADLKFDNPFLYKTGAYAAYSTLKLSNKNIYVGGNFFPYKVSKEDLVSDYANSKIRIGGGYAWSVRPQHAKPENIATAISDSGNIYSIGYKKPSSFYTAVDASGKILSDLEYKGKFCETTSMTEDGGNILAVRKSCDSSLKKASLVLLNSKTGKEQQVNFFPEEPEFIFAKNSQWYALSKDSAGNLIFESGSVKGEMQ